MEQLSVLSRLPSVALFMLPMLPTLPFMLHVARSVLQGATYSRNRSGSEADRARLLSLVREVAVLQHLNHPNIVSYLGCERRDLPDGTQASARTHTNEGFAPPPHGVRQRLRGLEAPNYENHE